MSFINIFRYFGKRASFIINNLHKDIKLCLLSYNLKLKQRLYINIIFLINKKSLIFLIKYIKIIIRSYC